MFLSKTDLLGVSLSLNVLNFNVLVYVSVTDKYYFNLINLNLITNIFGNLYIY